MKYIVGCILLLTTLLVNADEFRDGVIAYQQKNHKLALEKWLPLAEDGHILAQTLVGSMYAYGEGISQDDAKAVHWLSRAAKHGSAQAQYNLAIMYEKGLGIAANPEQAKKWFKAAADQGRKDAADRLALLNEKQASTTDEQAQAQSTQPKPVQTQPQEPEPDSTMTLTRNEESSRVEVVIKPKVTPPVTLTSSHTRSVAPIAQDFNGLKGINWLQQQPPGNYTIQLAASLQSRLIKAYIRQLELSEGYAHTITIRNNQNWHAIIYGSYSSFSSAQQALEALPDNWKAWRPWIREFSSVTALHH